MSWSGTVDNAHKLGDKVRVVKETMTLTNGKTGTIIGALSRNNIVTTEQWVGIQGTIATGYVTDNATLANLLDLSAEPINDAGAYGIVKTTQADGTWA